MIHTRVRRTTTKRRMLRKRTEKVRATIRGPWADPSSANVYAAEHFGMAVSDAQFKTLTDIVNFIQEFRGSKLYRHIWGRSPLLLKFTSRGSWNAYGGIRYVKRKVNGKMRDVVVPTITLPDNRHGHALDTIIHEMAHVLTKGGGHNERFCRMRLRLSVLFEGAHYARLLRRRYYQTGALRRPKKKGKK